MKTKMTLILGLITLSSAVASETVFDETYTTTFSHFNKLDEMLKCEPGYRGGFATEDTLILNSNTIATGYTVNMGDFYSFSGLGLAKDPPHSRGRRPYAEGCQLAIDQFKEKIAGKDIIEISVHRTGTRSTDLNYRPVRNVAGENLSIQQFYAEEIYEYTATEIGGFDFFGSRTITLKTVK